MVGSGGVVVDMGFAWRPPAMVLALVGLLASGCAFITRASVDTLGGDPNAFSGAASISADGRYVAFYSAASDLVPGDGNGREDVFVRDLGAGTTTRVSVNTNGGDSGGNSGGPSISADGRYVAFFSAASDLVPGDGNGRDDVFVRDLGAGTTTRVSVDTTGGDSNGLSINLSLSASGRYVAFDSDANDLVSDDGTGGNGVTDVFVRDLRTNKTTRASVDTTGGDSDASSRSPSISGDGRYVAFESEASDLVPGDGNGVADVFVRDLRTNATTRVSLDTAGNDTDGGSLGASISAEGRHVAFFSVASDLVSGDGNGLADVFVRDLRTNATTRASVDAVGTDSNGDSRSTSISGDGRYVAFRSDASDLVPSDGNGVTDVFVRDLQTGTITRVSVDFLGREANERSEEPDISADAHFIAFHSYASNLVPGDGTGADIGADIFVRALMTSTVDSITPETAS